MSFQTPTTIKDALDRMSSHEYILPAIQREFEWDGDKVCGLFDSLMRKYPIGSFLFWEIPQSEIGNYVFYDFVRDYHKRDAPHCPIIERDRLPRDRPVTAILDGQQRLTALSVGLRGSYAAKLPYKWESSPDAYPVKRLYLNLASPADENDQQMEYAFKFMTEQEAIVGNKDGAHWFLLSGVLDFDEAGDIYEYVVDHGLADPDNKFAYRTLARLHEMVNHDGTIGFFEVGKRELDEVLGIFVRVNSGGVQLSYSDILLSIAVAQWTQLDARDKVFGLVDELNKVAGGFSFTKDLVLKAGLVLSDAGDVRFKVTNFNRTNMGLLEQRWDSCAQSLRLAVDFLAHYGFSRDSLPSNYVLVPLAYYFQFRELNSSYLSSSQYDSDRQAVWGWVVRALLKAGVWGSSQDQLLTRLRQQIREFGQSGFPVEQIESEMARMGKRLRFEPEEIEEILDLRYGKPRTFAALSLLYPRADFEQRAHADHIFAQHAFRKTVLTKAGVPEESIPEFEGRRDGLPNLQLLPGTINIQKQEMMPWPWLRLKFPGEDDQAQMNRENYLALHDMSGLPEEIIDFPKFYDDRRDRMRKRLVGMLGA